MFAVGAVLLIGAMLLSMLSRSMEEPEAGGYLSCNGLCRELTFQLTEVGPGCAFDLRKAHPELKGRFSCFRVAYHVEDARFYL